MFSKIADYLDGKKTLLVQSLGATFNILVWGHVIKVDVDGCLLAGTVVLGVASYCRLIAKTPGPLAKKEPEDDPKPPTGVGQ